MKPLASILNGWLLALASRDGVSTFAELWSSKLLWAPGPTDNPIWNDLFDVPCAWRTEVLIQSSGMPFVDRWAQHPKNLS